MKAIQSDPRFNALRKIGEKKSLWNTWKGKRAKEEREEKILKAKEARENLMKVGEKNSGRGIALFRLCASVYRFLSPSHAPLLLSQFFMDCPAVTPDARFHRIATAFDTVPEYKAVEEKDRREIFEDAVYAKKREVDERHRAEAGNVMAEFKELLRGIPGA